MIPSIKRLSLVLLTWIAGGAAVVAIAAIYSHVQYGSPRALSALMRGDGLLVSPSTVNLGDVQFGERRDVALRLKNISHRDLRVTGFRTTCTCVAASDLPLALPAGAEGEVTLTIHARAPTRRYRQAATLYVSGQASREVSVIIVSEVDPTSIPKRETRPAGAAVPQRTADEPRS